MDSEAATGVFETREDAGEGSRGAYVLWQTALGVADGEEKAWRDRADKALKRYRDEEASRSTGFNILYSSVQTQLPAIYNSTPRPDVRRRFGDDDPAGKVAAQIFERSLSFCVDDYDFDSVMESVALDSLLPGRGVAMVVYDPVVGEDGVDYETVRCEHVQWEDFRHGPAKKWSDVPWVAVRYRITRKEAVRLNPKEGPRVTLDHVNSGVEKREGRDVPDAFKRLTVWKIWDKVQGKVLFFAPSYKDGLFASEDDVLGLKGFFPFPRPLYDIPDSTSLVPQVPFEKYKDQAEELDRITRRLRSLINVLRWRGIRPSQIEEFDRLKDAEDGDLVPSESFSSLLMTQGANPDSAVWLMPIERLIQVVRELVIQREAVKQVVFEISGLADIMRGESNPNETLGAQQIKAQWGSMRMQRRQREVQRFARDLLRIKAEIIGEHFSNETLSASTGIRLPTQQEKEMATFAAQNGVEDERIGQLLQLPSWEDVREVMGSDAMRGYRVDIETDSTIEADQVRAQQNMGAFVQGLGAFSEAIGPGVQAGLIPMGAATDLLSAFARKFNLGRQAEDALDRIGKQAPKQQGDDGAAQAEAQRLQAEQQAAQAEEARKQQGFELEQRRLDEASRNDIERAWSETNARIEQRAVETAQRAAQRPVAANG